MFKNAREYTGLDDFYGTSSTSSLNGWKAVEERINETESLYRDWQLNLWPFTSEHEETQYLINEVHDTIEIMRSGVLTYIVGDFNASIQSSSAAVEKIGNVILYLDFVKCTPSQTFSTPQSDWISINTVYGTRYYDKRWNRVVQRGSKWVIFKHSMLNGDMLKAMKKSGYPSELLLNQGDSFDTSIFVSRRNAAAHGDFSRILIEEQLHGYVVNGPDDLARLVNNKKASLDQYSKASNFIIETLKIYDQRYK